LTNLQNVSTIDQCISKLQEFILRAFKQSSTFQYRKKHTLITDGEDQVAINKLIKLRNYYRRKKFRSYRNVLHNLIKAALLDSRNNYWNY